MIRERGFLIAMIMVVGLGMSQLTLAQNEQPARDAGANSESVRSATVLTIHGKIAAIDKATKQITLEAANGRKVTFGIENPYNIEAAKVGDPVVVRYYEIVTVRKKKAGETMPSASVQEGIATAKPGGVPGGIAEQKISLALTVTAIDMANGTVTIKAPDGTTETVKARNPRNLQTLKVGDELIVSLSRATAISVAKESAS